MRQPRLALVAEGDAETRDCWSGSAQRFVQALRRAGASVDPFNVELTGWRRALVAAASFRWPREAWRGRYLFHPLGHRLRSRLARSRLRHASPPYDAVIQIGATFDAKLPGIPMVLYCDGNVRHAARGAPFSDVSRLVPAVLDAMARREGSVYARADRIWCMSDALARSFSADFGVPPERLRTIYAGPNLEMIAPRSPPAPGGKPVVLFVGKLHERKGSGVLLSAWTAVRSRVPAAELHFVGCRPAGSGLPGIVAHGFVPGDQPEGRALLSRLYAEATVFCLPSRFEPFGIVFVEAMLAGLPCIGTDRWAMPELIERGVTGWIIPDGDAAALSTALVEALTDRERSARMGLAGRARAERLFTWDRAAGRAMDDLDGLIANTPPRASHG